MPLRVSTLKEREDFYKNEFSSRDVYAWFRKNKVAFPQIYAIDFGSETKIIKDKSKIGKMVSFIPADLKGKLADALPEDVYYDRNRYKNPKLALKKLDFKNAFSSSNFLGQELAFDIDANNFRCSCRSVCRKCIGKSVENSIKAARQLEGMFKRISLVYSGRGMHVHVFDKKAYLLSIEERESINKRLKGLGIDPWVSRGRIRLVRLPFSLNALVSRKVVPLTVEEALHFDPLTTKKTLPGFLR